MSADYKQLKQFTQKIEGLKDEQLEKFIKSCSKELAARLLQKVIKRTPVREHGGGTLRRGWTGEKNANVMTYVNSLEIKHHGNKYMIDIINPVEYASYVEYGHRTVDHKEWVQGKFMLTISEEEIRQAAPKILEAKLTKYLKGLTK